MARIGIGVGLGKSLRHFLTLLIDSLESVLKDSEGNDIYVKK